MIIKGNPAGNVGFWSKHLLRDDTNERAEIKEVRGLLADDLRGALREMQAVASGSRCHGNFMYQAHLNPRDYERLNPEQWMEAVDRLEKNLGLEGHQRVVIEHVKEGRQHYHVVWNRVDVDTMRVTDMGGNYRIHERTARELELRFGHHRTRSSARESRQPGWELWELRAAEKSGIDPKDIKTELTALWRQSDTGQAFKAAIEERGYVLAQGDRRDFVVVDRAGDAHSLARRLDGVNTRQVREKMADLDRSALPLVEEARVTQRGRSDGPQREEKVAEPVREARPMADPVRATETSRAEQLRRQDETRGQGRGALWEVFPALSPRACLGQRAGLRAALHELSSRLGNYLDQRSFIDVSLPASGLNPDASSIRKEQIEGLRCGYSEVK